MIIKSILDTDLYKFSMMQVVLHQFPRAEVEYDFKCRNNHKFTKKEVNKIEKEIDNLTELKLTLEEEIYLKTLPFLTNDYIQFVKLFRFNPNYIFIDWIEETGVLSLSIKGPWLHTILYEVPILAIISEICCDQGHDLAMEKGGKQILKNIFDIKKLISNDFSFADFGTRRRYSHDWQDFVIKQYRKDVPMNFVGTSNVYFAMKNKGLNVLGTMAHEFLQACQALKPRLVDSQKFALETWVQEYRGNLGIALTDVINMDAFLKDFDLFFAKLYDGARHDSGCPYIWARKLINHYHRLGIEATTKTAVFSDGLDMAKAVELYREFYAQIQLSFGIGTKITNDIEGVTPLNIVLKMTRCNGQDVAKISDSPGKSMCKNPDYSKYLRQVFSV